MSSKSINLRNLINLNSSELPEEFDKSNVIYKITNTLNGSAYIGQSGSFKSRIFSRNGYKSNISRWILSGFEGRLFGKLFPAFRQYGIDSFEVSILEFNVSPSELGNREMYWISHFNTYSETGYNNTRGGEIRPTKETKEAKRLNNELMLRIYSETNGVAPSYRYIKSKISYMGLMRMCEKIKATGFQVFNCDLYRLFKDEDAPDTYTKYEFKRQFNNYREFGFDISLISSCIRSDWQ